jgi:hypothetical protein
MTMMKRIKRTRKKTMMVTVMHDGDIHTVMNNLSRMKNLRIHWKTTVNNKFCSGSQRSALWNGKPQRAQHEQTRPCEHPRLRARW